MLDVLNSNNVRTTQTKYITYKLICNSDCKIFLFQSDFLSRLDCLLITLSLPFSLEKSIFLNLIDYIAIPSIGLKHISVIVKVNINIFIQNFHVILHVCLFWFPLRIDGCFWRNSYRWISLLIFSEGRI